LALFTEDWIMKRGEWDGRNRKNKHLSRKLEEMVDLRAIAADERLTLKWTHTHCVIGFNWTIQ
jgi:hypothetical protein